MSVNPPPEGNLGQGVVCLLGPQAVPGHAVKSTRRPGLVPSRRSFVLAQRVSFLLRAPSEHRYCPHTVSENSPKRNSGSRKRITHAQPVDRTPRRHRRPANKGRRYPAEILTADEVRALIRACSNRAPTGIRNRALLVLLYRGGCRISEALRLLPKDLDRAAGTASTNVEPVSAHVPGNRLAGIGS